MLLTACMLANIGIRSDQEDLFLCIPEKIDVLTAFPFFFFRSDCVFEGIHIKLNFYLKIVGIRRRWATWFLNLDLTTRTFKISCIYALVFLPMRLDLCDMMDYRQISSVWLTTVLWIACCVLWIGSWKLIKTFTMFKGCEIDIVHQNLHNCKDHFHLYSLSAMHSWSLSCTHHLVLFIWRV